MYEALPLAGADFDWLRLRHEAKLHCGLVCNRSLPKLDHDPHTASAVPKGGQGRQGGTTRACLGARAKTRRVVMFTFHVYDVVSCLLHE